jgi:hypothetical protein
VEDKQLNILKEFYNIDELSVYDVFGNYYDGKKVHFYKITAKPTLHQSIPVNPANAP